MHVRSFALAILLVVARFSSAASGSLPAPDVQRLAESFVVALERDDPRILADLGIDLSDFTKSSSVTDLFDRYQDIRADLKRVDVIGQTGDLIQIQVEIAGSAAILGGSGRRIDLARCWTLQLARANDRLQLASALTSEDQLATAAASAAPEALDSLLKGALEDERCIRPEAFLQSVADLAGSRGPPGIPTVDWVQRVAEERNLPAAQWMAARMRSLALANSSPMLALESGEQALQIATRANDAMGIVSSRFEIAVVHWFAQQPDVAAEWFRSTAAYLDATPDPLTVLHALYMAIYLELDRKSLRVLLQRCDELRAILDRFQAPHSRMDLEFLLHNIHARLRNWQVAADYSRHAVASAQLVGDVYQQAAALVDLAGDLIELDDLPSAAQAVKQALALGRVGATRAEILCVQGKLLRLQNRPQAAHDAFSEAATLSHDAGEHLSESKARNGLALIALDRGEPEVARAEAQRALELLLGELGPSRLQETDPAWPVRTTLGRAQHALHRDAEAEANLRLAIAEIEESRLEAGDALGRSVALGGTTTAYEVLLDLLVGERRIADALDVAESTKARALRDALAQGRIDRSRGFSADDRTRETELEAALATANRKLLAATDAASRTRIGSELTASRMQLQKFRSELLLRHPQLPLVRADDSRGWDKRAVPPGMAAVEFAVLPERTLAFVIRRRGDALAVDVVSIPVPRAELRGMVEDLADRISRRDPQYKDQAAALYALMLGPVARLLEGADTIAIVPDDALWRLPIQLLADFSGNALAETPVFRAPSLRALAAATALPRPPQRPLRVLAIGNPRIPDVAGTRARAFQPELVPGDLPEAEREANAVARLYGKSRSMVLTGAAARESVFERQAPKFDVIHVAAHGMLDDRAPIYSALLLATGHDDPAEDGLLEAREIAELSLRARLVVLSACDTGRGRVGAGEGQIGMSWAFMAAGVATVVVSDWKADSAATEKLMVEFHRQLLDGRRPAAALRLAQNVLRRDPRYAHPYYWAPFMVVGVGS